MLTHPEMIWQDCGQVILKGGLLQYMKDFEQWIMERFSGYESNYEFGALIQAETLQRIDYFTSFPHLLSMRATVQSDKIEEFSSTPIDADGRVNSAHICANNELLCPAACYHLYPLLSGQYFDKVKIYSLASPCFRNEDYIKPFCRMRQFRMRELVCIGPKSDVTAFLDDMRAKLTQQLSDWGVPFELQVANDPFWGGNANPKMLLQSLEPVKEEIVFRCADQADLAISSFNYHRSLFSDNFDLRTRRNDKVVSACFAFGLERWLYALMEVFGPNAEQWPQLKRSVSCVY